MEAITSFVSSRGILHSCSQHNRSPVSSSPLIDHDFLEGLKSGGSLYVCTHALAVFAIHFLPRINVPFALVSGDSDISLDASIINHPQVAAILSHPLLQTWHAQNLCVSAPKLYALPIGLDYHTIATSPRVWSMETASPIAQERSLLSTLAEAPNFTDRAPMAYCNWQFELARGDRQECLMSLDASAAFFEPSKVPRQATWQRQSQMMFVISPFGGGLDCHRTWEALALGCVPVLRRSPLTKLFAGLPCLFVDDWTQVTPAFLRESAQRFSAAKFQFASLFKEFWLRQVRGESSLILPEMTLCEFRRFMTSRAA
jgi:hypothetical protein